MYSIFGKIADNGRMAVQFFFVISSFLAFKSFSNFVNVDRYLYSSIRWIIKKYLSLMPLYLIALVCFYFWHGGSYREGYAIGNIQFLDVTMHLLLLHGLVPFYNNSIMGVEWYLGVLMLFYIITPILFFIVNDFRKSLIFLLTSCIFSLLVFNLVRNYFSEIDYSGYFENNSIWIQLPVLSLGICLYHLFTNNDIDWTKCYFLIFSFLSYIFLGLIYNFDGVFLPSKVVFVGLICALFLIILSRKKIKIIDNSFFSLYGKFSYPIYLYHYLMIYIGYIYFHFSLYKNIIWSIIISFIIGVVLQKSEKRLRNYVYGVITCKKYTRK